MKHARVWRQLAALAFAAIGMLVLRPLCEAAEPLGAAGGGWSQLDAAHGHDSPANSDFCCLSMSGASIKSAAIAVPGLAKLSFVPPALSAVTQPAAPEHRRTALDPVPPRRSSYPARSARLLL